MNEPYVFKKGDVCYANAILTHVDRAYKTPSGDQRVSVTVKGKKLIFERTRSGTYHQVSEHYYAQLYTTQEWEFVIASREVYDDFKKLGLLVEKAQGAVRDAAGTKRLRQLRALIQGVLSQEVAL